MRKLLEFVVYYLQVLYLNPSYRFSDSTNRGLADVDASVTLSSEVLRWVVTNDRGQFDLTVYPVRFAGDDNWFWLSLIRQYLDGGTDAEQGSIVDQIVWLSENLGRIEQLFSDEVKAPAACADLVALRQSNAYKNWGWPKPDAE